MSRRIERPSVPPLTEDEQRELASAQREFDVDAERARNRRRRPTRAASGVPRARTIPRKYITRAVLAAESFVTTLVPDGVLEQRPRRRADCLAGGCNEERPCPWVACKHHLYLDVNPTTGSIKLNYPNLEPWDLADSCALDIADRGANTLEEVGRHMNVTRERVRQVELDGYDRLKHKRTIKEAA